MKKRRHDPGFKTYYAKIKRGDHDEYYFLADGVHVPKWKWRITWSIQIAAIAAGLIALLMQAGIL